MEALVGLALAIFFFIRAINKAKEGHKSEEKPQTPVKRPPMETFFGDLVDFDKQQTATQPRQTERPQGVNENIRSTELEYGKSFSMEGTKSTEGECIEENPKHCAVEHIEDSVYVNEITDTSEVAFDRQDLVKGIIMAEILSKPKCFD